MKRVALFAVLALLLVGLSEAALRLYGFGRGIRYRPHPTLGWTMIPGQRAFNVRGRAEVRVNALGFRGPEVATPKSASTLRILFLGDGTTLNNQTPEAQTFPFLVAGELARALGREVESIVGATSGYQLEQELEQARLHLPSLRPDVVVLGFCWNDWAPSTQLAAGTGPTAFGEYAGGESWLERAAIVDFWSRLQRIRMRQRAAAAHARGEGQSNATDDAIWQHVGSTLDSTVALCRRHGAIAALVLMPAPITANAPEDYAKRTAKLQDWASTRGVVWVDPAPVFAAADPSGTGLFLDHLHLGPAAQPIVAAALVQELRARLLGTGISAPAPPEAAPIDPITLPGGTR